MPSSLAHCSRYPAHTQPPAFSDPMRFGVLSTVHFFEIYMHLSRKSSFHFYWFECVCLAHRLEAVARTPVQGILPCLQKELGSDSSRKPFPLPAATLHLLGVFISPSSDRS